MTQATLDVVLGTVVGTAVFCCWYLVQRAGSLAYRHARFARYNERLLSRLHELVHLHNEVMLCEQAIAQLVEDAPAVEHARFARRMVELAGAIPPLVLAQVWRFGLADPPPAVPVPVPEPGPPAEHVAVVDSEPTVVVTATEDAWGGEQ